MVLMVRIFDPVSIKPQLQAAHLRHSPNEPRNLRVLLYPFPARSTSYETDRKVLVLHYKAEANKIFGILLIGQVEDRVEQ
ncbi:hypothetical protein AK812_SmicGene48091, partial [Symbiodinium microadriaticum]